MFPLPITPVAGGDSEKQNSSRRLSTLLGIKKVCPANVELYVKSCANEQGGVNDVSIRKTHRTRMFTINITLLSR